MIKISICWQKTFRRHTLVEDGYYLVSALLFFWPIPSRMTFSERAGCWVALQSHLHLESHPNFRFVLHCLHPTICFHVTTVFGLICDCLLILHWDGRIRRIDCPFYILDNVSTYILTFARLKLTIAYRPTLVALDSSLISLVNLMLPVNSNKYLP